MQRVNWRNFDFWLLGAMILAIGFGVTMIRSAIAGNEVLVELPQRQIIFATGGLVVILLIAMMDYRYLLVMYMPIYIVMLILLFIIFLGAQAVFGAARWLQLGELFIQPTELAKIVEILLLARYFEKTREQSKDLRWVAGSFWWVGSLAFFIFLQPNLSNVIVMLVIWAAMLWQAGLPLKYVFMMGAAGLVLGAMAFPFLEPYQQARVLNFLFPDPNATYGAVYNVLQALIAIGSGGWTGKGYGAGTQTQLRFLKVRHTDFIFSAISEEFGFVGAAFVILLIGFIIWRCLHIAAHARDLSGSLIAYGVATLLFFQGAVNIAVNLNLIPVTGLPLPFISYGGSGLLSLMLGIGLAESVAVHRQVIEF
jgi:rod shape determining protein RodA